MAHRKPTAIRAHVRSTVRSRTAWACLAGLIFPALFAGCQQPLQQRLAQRRQENLENTLHLLERSEEKRPASFQRTLDLLAEKNERDVANTSQMPHRIDEAVEDRFRQWEQRSGDREKKFNELMEGDPEGFARSLSRIFN